MNAQLTNEEQLVVNSEVQKMGKSMALAYVLDIFLGTLGIHRFYLGKTGSAAALLTLTILGWITAFILIGFFLIAISGIWTIVDLFLIPGIIRAKNEKIERSVESALLSKRS
ncbi:MAG: TM2 domain-containing protein [Sporolactobacillus sp.]